MNKYSSILFGAATMMALASCSSDDGEYGTDKSTARQIIPVSELNVMSRASQGLQSTAITEGVQVGFLVTDGAETSTVVEANNSMLTANGSNGFAQSTTNLYFPLSGIANVYAYAPYQSTITDLTGDNTFEVSTDQSDDEDYLASDLLIGAPTGNPVSQAETTDNKVTVKFSHMLTKVNLNVDGDLNPAKLKIKNTKTKCTFNIVNGTVTASGDAGEITAATVSSDATTAGDYKFAAIIIPQSFTDDEAMIELTTQDGKTYSCVPTEDITLDSEKEYTFEIAESTASEQVTMTLVSELDNWTDGGTIGTTTTETVVEREPHVGDWYTAEGKYVDGSATAPTNTIGIVFSTTLSDEDKTAGYTCYVSALTDLANKAFATKDTEAATAAINGEDNFITTGDDALNALNGLSLTTTLTALSNYSDYTAFNTALTSYDALYKAPETVSSGWFIPSIGQMAQLAAYVYGGTQTGKSSATTITPSDDTSAGYDNTTCAKQIAQLVSAGVITYNSSTAFLNGGTAYVEVTGDDGTVTSKTSDPSYLTITEKTATNIWTITFNQSKTYAFSTSNGKTASKRVHLILAAK